MAQGIGIGHNERGIYIQEPSEIGNVHTPSFSILETQLRQFREITKREKTSDPCDVLRCIRNVSSAVITFRADLEQLKTNPSNAHTNNVILGEGNTSQTATQIFELLIQNLEDAGPYFQGRLKIMNLEKSLQSFYYWLYGMTAFAVAIGVAAIGKTYF